MKDKEKKPLYMGELGEGDDKKPSAELFKRAREYMPPEGARGRVWRGIERKLEEPSESVWSFIFRPRRIAYLTAVAALALGLFLFSPKEEVGNPIQFADALKEAQTGEIITAETGAGKLIEADEFIKLYAHPGAKAVLHREGNSSKITVRLMRGALSVYVTPDKEREFEVISLWASYSVIGTSFYVSHRGDKAADLLQVYSGKVRVMTAENIETISAGYCAETRRRAEAADCSLFRTKTEGGAWAEVPETLPAEFGAEILESISVLSKPKEAAVIEKAPEEVPSLEETVKTISEGSGSGAIAKYDDDERWRVKKREEKPSENELWLALQTGMITMRPEMRLKEIKKFIADYPRMAARSEVLAAMADAYKGSQNPGKAFEAYLQLYRLNERGQWRESALYEMGMIAMYSLNSPRDAIRYWTELRRDFPNGALKEEAEFNLARAQIAIGRHNEARLNLENFTRSYIGSPNRSKALFALASLYREYDNNCPKAVEAYESFLAVSTEQTTQREEAIFYRAACLEKTGEKGRAKRGYLDYLNRYPQGKFSNDARSRLE